MSYRNAWIIGIVVGVISAIAMFIYTKSLGRGLMAILILIMAPLAITEIGTDGWITAAMQGFAEKNNFPPVLVLIYTSAIMLVLRFFAGPIIKALTPLGLLIVSAALATIGLVWISNATAGVLIVAATFYALGKTFFWPTTLGVVSEQTPKGGALTLNAISGIGMLACGAIGFPLLGLFQTNTEKSMIAESELVQKHVPGVISDGVLTAVSEKDGLFGKYSNVDAGAISSEVEKLSDAGVRESVTAAVGEIASVSPKASLKKIAIFPAIMLIAYIGLFLMFKAKGGYKPVNISDH